MESPAHDHGAVPRQADGGPEHRSAIIHPSLCAVIPMVRNWAPFLDTLYAKLWRRCADHRVRQWRVCGTFPPDPIEVPAAGGDAIDRRRLGLSRA